MTFFQIFLTVSCVLAISIGQLLFKKVSININQSDRLFSFEVLGTFSLAIFIYGLATLFWIYILKSTPLNQAYSFMAIYLHPREIEKEQEKIELKMLENFIHYHGIKNCEKKLTSLVEIFSDSFIRMDEYAKEIKKI